MSDAAIFWTWSIITIVGVVGVHAFASYEEAMKRDVEDLRLMGTVTAIVWPLSLTIMIVVGALGLLLYWGPRFLIDVLVVRPRLRRAAAELTAKAAADAARHEVERGAHR